MTVSPFAGCRTMEELRAQLDALNRIYWLVWEASR